MAVLRRAQDLPHSLQLTAWWRRTWAIEAGRFVASYDSYDGGHYVQNVNAYHKTLEGLDGRIP
jgi:hypothetical protein